MEKYWESHIFSHHVSSVRGVARLSTLGGQERNISSFFYYFFPQFFLIFFKLVLWVSSLSTQKGPGFATELCYLHVGNCPRIDCLINAYTVCAISSWHLHQRTFYWMLYRLSLHVNLILQSEYACVQKRCWGTYVQWLRDRNDVTAKLKLNRLKLIACWVWKETSRTLTTLPW